MGSEQIQNEVKVYGKWLIPANMKNGRF